MADGLNLEGMTDEQLLALLRQAGGGQGEQPAKPEPVSVKIGNDEITADTPEELNKLLVQRLQALNNAPEPEPEPVQPTPNTPAEKPSWDMDRFAKLFVKDPREGLEYMEMAEYGMPVRKVIPSLVGLVGVMAQKLQEIETQQFLNSTPEYEPSVENRKAIEKIMSERGWQPTRQTLEDAFAIARSRGMIHVEDVEEEPQPKPGRKGNFIPPRTPRVATEQPQPTAEEIVALAENMPIEKLEELLFNSGVINSRRLSQ